MVFFGWALIEDLATAVAMLAAAGFAFWIVRDKKRSLRWTVRIPSVPVAGLALLMTLLALLEQGCKTYSEPVYSPDEKMAFRVMEFDAGATGGGESVILYRLHGISSSTIFSGGWQSITAQDVRWVSPSRIVIASQGRIYKCSRAFEVSVQCFGGELHP